MVHGSSVRVVGGEDSAPAETIKSDRREKERRIQDRRKLDRRQPERRRNWPGLAYNYDAEKEALGRRQEKDKRVTQADRRVAQTRVRERRKALERRGNQYRRAKDRLLALQAQASVVRKEDIAINRRQAVIPEGTAEARLNLAPPEKKRGSYAEIAKYSRRPAAPIGTKVSDDTFKPLQETVGKTVETVGKKVRSFFSKTED